MIGYGILNSRIHEICVVGIIKNFLARSLFIIPQYYSNVFNSQGTKKIDINKINFSDIKPLFNLFLEEDEKITILETNVSGQNLYKYLLSSNVIKNKDYKFREKALSEVIEDGKKNLQDIFLETFKKFFDDDLVKSIFIEYDQTQSFDNFNFFEYVGQYFPEPNLGLLDYISLALVPIIPAVGIPLSIALITDFAIDQLTIEDGEKIKIKKYKKLYSKLEKLHSAIAGPGTDEKAIINIIKDMSAEERCYLCTRYRQYQTKSMLKVLEEDLNDKVDLLFFDVGSDLSQQYLYNPLNCAEFKPDDPYVYWDNKGAEESLEDATKRENAVCKKHFEGSRYSLRYTSESSSAAEIPVNQESAKFLVIDKNYIKDNKIFNGCYKFFRDNKFLNPRDNYLRILNEQISVLET